MTSANEREADGDHSCASANSAPKASANLTLPVQRRMQTVSAAITRFRPKDDQRASSEAAAMSALVANAANPEIRHSASEEESCGGSLPDMSNDLLEQPVAGDIGDRADAH